MDGNGVTGDGRVLGGPLPVLVGGRDAAGIDHLGRSRPAGHAQRWGDPEPTRRAAILIASKDGESTITDAVGSAVGQADVFVVSDGSTDRTAEVAREAGARVLDLPVNVGKPAAIHKAAHELGLLDAYEFVAVIDDDTILADDFIERCLDRMAGDRRTANRSYAAPDRRRGERRHRHTPVARERRANGVVVTVGKTITAWQDQGEHRWNPWLAARAYSYWRYQVTVRPGQSAFNALNCISGSNSVYRSQLLRQVLVERTPYIVDDTYWVLETQRRKLGRVLYVPTADAYVQDPTTFRSWYKQNLRWLWGTCQGIIGHRVGRHKTWFDFWYVTLILDWLLYVILWPILLILMLKSDWMQPQTALGGLLIGYTVWVAAAAAALRKARLLAFLPFIILFDWLYRVNFLHAAIKAVRQPTVESCRWDSPARYQLKGGA